MAIASRTSNEKYSVSFLSFGEAGREYRKAEGLIENGSDFCRLRILEQDDGIKYDVWNGDYNGRSFKPGSFLYNERVEDADRDVVPEDESQLREFMEEFNIAEQLEAETGATAKNF